MELEKNTANAFINYLKKHGYPEDSIVTEWGDSKHRIDIAILDENRKYPVAIYEIKGFQNINSTRAGLEQLHKFQKYLGYAVEAGLVFRHESPPFFKVIDVTKNIFRLTVKSTVEVNDEQEVNFSEPINYENISKSAEPKVQKVRIARKEKYLDRFKFISWLFCFTLIVLLVFENLGCITFTPERLIVMGVIILMALIPFFSEIKLGDISLKRMGSGGSEKDKK